MEYKIRWSDDHLEHHGILGMKWGVRRYQNPDGSLTPAGKKRYAKDSSFVHQKPIDTKAYLDHTRKEVQEKRRNRSDAENEKELLDSYKAWGDDNVSVNDPSFKKMYELHSEINYLSLGDGFFDDGAIASPKAKEWHEKYVKLLDDTWDDRHDRDGTKSTETIIKAEQYFRQEKEKLYDELCGIALEDLGFKDTPRNRALIYGLVNDQPNKELDEFEHSDDHLEHHGILGQKWGVRRYQNEDGSLTAEGKKRYAKDIKRSFDKQYTKEFRAILKGDYNTARNLHKNERELQKKIVDEVKNTKEYKDAYDVAARMNNANGRVLDKSLVTEWNTKQRSYSEKLSDLLDKYHGDVLGAKLKDIGMEDTTQGREIVFKLLSNTNWWSDFKYDTSKSIRGD